MALLSVWAPIQRQRSQQAQAAQDAPIPINSALMEAVLMLPMYRAQLLSQQGPEALPLLSREKEIAPAAVAMDLQKHLPRWYPGRW